MARNPELSLFKAAITLEPRTTARQMLGRRVLSVTQWYGSINGRSARRTRTRMRRNEEISIESRVKDSFSLKVCVPTTEKNHMKLNRSDNYTYGFSRQ